ncbi:ATP-dependent helicase [bacterium]|nr:MAG: ATP-dependent helicase [bacterium]
MLLSRETLVPTAPSVPPATALPSTARAEASMPTELTPRAQQRRIIEHDPRAPLVVIAGAGSGKTATLVERIRWLVRHENVEPRGILAVTFSRSAAAELSARLAVRLGSRGDEIKVSTFHAFCREMLVLHAYRAELDPDLRVLEESEALTRFHEVYRELLHGRLGEIAVPAALDLIAPGKALALLYRLVTTVTEEGLTAQSLLASVRRAQRALWSGEGLPRTLAISGELRDGFYRTKARMGEPKAKEALARRHEAPSPDTLRAQMEMETTVARVMATVMERFDALLAERGEATYAHLIAHLDHLLDDDEHRSAIRARFTHCVVDEYQDTNAAQQRLVERIFGERLHGVMLVGDPRQSIYGFRNARPDEIERLAARHGAAGIDENFRSLQPILDAAHLAIAPQRREEMPMRALRDGTGNGEEVSVIAAQIQGRANGDAREREAEAIAAEAERLVAERGLAYAQIAILLRRKTHAQVYVDALARRGIPARTTGGVGFYQAGEVEEAMAWLRFTDDPTDDTAMLRVLGSGIIGANEETIAALAAPGSAEREVEERRLQLTRAVLVEPLPPALDGEARERVETLREIADELDGVGSLPLAEAVQRVLRASGLEYRYAAAAQESLDGRQALANLHRLIEIAQSFARDLPEARIPEFLEYLDGLREVAFDEREADPPAADAVTISTIHWAKGREWPAVFVAEVTRNVFPAYRAPDSVVWDYGERTLIVTRDQDGAPTYHALHARFSAGGDAAADAWRARELAEERRLFYVALTRARDRVYVCGTVSASGGGGESCSEFLAEVRALDGVRLLTAPLSLETSTPRAVAARAGGDDASMVELLRAQRARDDAERRDDVLPRSRDGGRMLSFTKLDSYATCPLRYAYEDVLGLPGLAEPTLPPNARNEIGAAEYGALIHAALECYNLERIAGERCDLLAAFVRSLDELQLHGRLGAERIAAARASLGAYLAHPLAQARVLGAEVPFSVEIGGTTIVGAIDLVAELGDRALIVDYKTGSGETDHYGLQLAIYREAATHLFGARQWETSLLLVRDGAVREVHPPETDAAERVREIAACIARGEYPARPGLACATCPYRGQPCTAYEGAPAMR